MTFNPPCDCMKCDIKHIIWKLSEIDRKQDLLMASVADVQASFDAYSNSVNAKLANLQAAVDANAADSAALDALKSQIDAANSALNPAPVEEPPVEEPPVV